MLGSRFRLLDGRDPADPFIARERRKVVPFFSDFLRREKGVAQIHWHGVDDAGSDCGFFLRHRNTVLQYPYRMYIHLHDPYSLHIKIVYALATIPRW
jgi:hypothetical protein